MGIIVVEVCLYWLLQCPFWLFSCVPSCIFHLSSPCSVFPGSLAAMVLDVILVLKITHTTGTWIWNLNLSGADPARSSSDGSVTTSCSGVSWFEELLSHHCRGSSYCDSLVWREPQSRVLCFTSINFFFKYLYNILFFTAEPWMR